MKANWIRAGAYFTTVVVFSSVVAAADKDLRLVNAAVDQDWTTVQRLIKQKVDVNATLPDGGTALLWTAHWNNLEIADLLLKAGAKMNAADDDGVTPLVQAVVATSPAMVEKLLKAGANPNAAEITGLTPLMSAAHVQNVEIVKALLSRGADVNAKAKESEATALMWAAADGRVELAKALIDAHADVHASEKNGFTPLLYAARAGNIEMARLLLVSGVKVDEAGSDGTHALPLAILQGHTDFALFLLDQGADANGSLGGVNALHIAAGGVDLWLSDYQRRQGHGQSQMSGFGMGQANLSIPDRVKLIKSLVARGADVNARTTTSGMFMSYIGYPTKGAFEAFSCGTGDVLGATPLWVAANVANGFGTFAASIGGADIKGDVVKALLDAGADIHLTTADGTTPLMVAAGLGKSTYVPGLQRGGRSVSAESAVRLLVEAGADVNAVNEADFTALHGAAFRGLDEVIEYLVKQGANIDARDYRGRTPYRLAEGSKQSFQFQSYPETAELLKKLGANTKLGVPGTVQERIRDVPEAPGG